MSQAYLRVSTVFYPLEMGHMVIHTEDRVMPRTIER